MSLGILIGSGIIGTLAGILFGAFPLRTSHMTKKQESYTSALGFVALGLFLVLILINQNLASYIYIGGLVLGFAIAKIPVIHNFFVARFKIFKPKNSTQSTK